MKSIYDNTFEHHGILGQKWGVKNGPPYPLDENSGSNSSGKHGGDKKKSGSSGKHRLSSLFRKRDKTQEEPKKDKVYKLATEEDVNVLRSEFKKVFRWLGDKYTDEGIERVMDRYMSRSEQNPRLAYNLWRYDLRYYNLTGRYIAHFPDQIPREYRKNVDMWSYAKKIYEAKKND